MNNKKLLTFLFLLVIIVIFGIIFFGNGKNKKTNTFSTPIFFYSTACPHCHEIERWMKDNQIENKIKIKKKEINHNQENTNELVQIAKKCQISLNNIGVPFLYIDNKCLMGTEEIISYLSKLK